MDSSILSEGIVYCTALYLAAQNGHRDVVKYISELNVAPPSEEMLRCTSLYFAAQNGQLEMVRLITASLLNGKKTNGQISVGFKKDKIDGPLKKTDVKLQDVDGNSALHYAAIGGDVDSIKMIISKGADVDCLNVDDESALHCAARNGHGVVVDLLLKQGANINCRDRLGNTPVHYAIQKNYCEVAKILLENKAEMNIANVDKKLPLDYVKSSDFVNVLLKHGKDVNVHDSFGNNLLHIAVKKNFTSAIATCLKAGIGIGSVNFCCNTALHFAAEGGNINNVKELLKHVLSYVKNANGDLPINLANKLGHRKIVKLLLNNERPLDTNVAFSTFLLTAVENGLEETVKNLLATKFFSDDDINRTMDTAIKINNVKIIEMLLLSLNNIHKINLVTFVNFGNPDLIKLILSMGVSARPDCNFNLSPLTYAVKKGNVGIVELILRYQKDSNSLYHRKYLPHLLASTCFINIRHMLQQYMS